jgi:hypothetical protein
MVIYYCDNIEYLGGKEKVRLVVKCLPWLLCAHAYAPISINNSITKLEIDFIFQLHYNSNLWPMEIPNYFIRCNHVRYEYIFEIFLNFFYDYKSSNVMNFFLLFKSIY